MQKTGIKATSIWTWRRLHSHRDSDPGEVRICRFSALFYVAASWMLKSPRTPTIYTAIQS